MANTIEALISSYRAAKLDANGESHEKCDVIQQLEDHLNNSKVLSFFLDLTADQNEYDMARVDALKILQLWEPPNGRVRNRVGRQLANALLVESDVLVQQWMAIAAGNFINVPDIFNAVTTQLANKDVNLEVRVNCLMAVKRLGPSEDSCISLKPLTEDPYIGKYVLRILNDWLK